MEQTDARRPSHQDHFTNSKRKKSQLRLRHVAKQSRQVLWRPSVDGIAVCHNSAAQRGDEPQDRLEERGLADAVRTQKTKHLAGVERKAYVFADQMATISESEILYAELHCDLTPRPVGHCQHPDEERRPDKRGKHAKRN